MPSGPWLQNAVETGVSVLPLAVAQALPKGAFAKLSNSYEEFWVIVDKVLGQGRYIGVVDSEMNMAEPGAVSLGTVLEFTFCHVIKAYNNGQEM